MARRLRPVELDFAESAPLRLVFSAEVTAPPRAVYRALAEDVANWPSWFTAVTAARPTGEGAGREVRLKGGTFFAETIMATEPYERYAYRVDDTNAPGLRALLEEWRLTPTTRGTRVQWTFAADGPVVLRIALRLGRAGLGSSFRGAMRNLDRRLTRSAAQQ
ncbi:SRPBCC family protein [Streptomyces sp. NBC_01142]|uniref:SRPBCC family protein n=1 Tax=Streptomyces sp. NBC_01142 TaxID=2975865 RepID=UPI00224F8397|nr:SRPBCC family protein [Streptomyces sp. NBC_01142]MCX4825134.1 SRPBCC family protein [Streptomyces sp. NBC_01142]